MEDIIEMLAKQNQLLDRIEIIEAGKGSALEQLLVIEKERDKKNSESISFGYPDNGTAATIKAGETKLDYFTGKNTDVDGVVTKMPRSLQNVGRRWLRSYMVNANKSIGLQIDDEDVMFIEDGYAIGRQLEFKKMSIKTTEETELFIHVSTNPNTTLELTSDKTRIAALVEAVIDPLTLSGYSNELLTKLLGRD